MTEASRAQEVQSPTGRTGAIDLGRVVAVTFFGALTVFNVLALGTRALRAGGPEFLDLLVSTLTICFFFLLIVSYLRRNPAQATDRRWGSWVVALTGTAAPFLIPLVSPGRREPDILAGLAAAVLTCGLCFMLWALVHLGRNVSVVPQAREVVTTGPYGWVRHPLYVAELVNVLGICLSLDGVWPWVVLASLAVFQLLRARREEELLARQLSGYARYRATTPMLLPRPRRLAHPTRR